MKARVGNRRYFFRRSLPVVFFAILCLCMPARAGLYGAKQTTLKNGLRVIVIENPRAPLVAQLVCYQVGGADDPLGKSGLAHYLEHMMFKGPKESSHVRILSLVESWGGSINAMTSNDYTIYYEIVPKKHLETIVRMEADRMRGLMVIPEQAMPELKVVLEEQLMRIENNPAGQFFQELEAAYYRRHPYGNPLIGWIQEVKTFTPQDVKAFHDTWYAPNNAILVFAGDITFEQAKGLAEKYYETIPMRKLPERKRVQEPPVVAQSTVTFHSDKIDTPTLVLMYPTFRFNGKDLVDIIAAEVVEQLLGGTATSYLYRRLIEDKKVATSVSVSLAPISLDPRPCYITLSASSFASLNDLQKVYDTELAVILKKGFTAEEVEKVKKRILVSVSYLKDSLMMNADGLVEVLSQGFPIEYLENYPELIQKVTVDDVNRVFRKIFGVRPATKGYLLPKDMNLDSKPDKKKAGQGPLLQPSEKGIS